MNEKYSPQSERKSFSDNIRYIFDLLKRVKGKRKKEVDTSLAPVDEKNEIEMNPTVEKLICEKVKLLLYPDGFVNGFPKLVEEDQLQKAAEDVFQSLVQKGIVIDKILIETILEDAYFSRYDIETSVKPGVRYRDETVSLETNLNDTTSSSEVSAAFEAMVRNRAEQSLRETADNANVSVVTEEQLTPKQIQLIKQFIQDQEGWLKEAPQNGERYAMSVVDEVYHREDGQIVVYHVGLDGYRKAFIYDPKEDPDLDEQLQNVALGEVLITKYGNNGLISVLSRKLIQMSHEEKIDLIKAIQKVEKG